MPGGASGGKSAISAPETRLVIRKASAGEEPAPRSISIPIVRTGRIPQRAASARRSRKPWESLRGSQPLEFPRTRPRIRWGRFGGGSSHLPEQQSIPGRVFPQKPVRFIAQTGEGGRDGGLPPRPSAGHLTILTGGRIRQRACSAFCESPRASPPSPQNASIQIEFGKCPFPSG